MYCLLLKTTASLGAQTSIVTEYPIPTTAAVPEHITVGPDSALWFTHRTDTIGRITTAGVITEYAVPGAGGAGAIAAGSDGALWFTQTDSIGRMTTAGVITEYAVPGAGGNSTITAGPDGELWFTEYGEIGRITTAGAITLFSIPTSGPTGGITAGPDGALWFGVGNYIGRITTEGAITEYAVPFEFGSNNVQKITVGPDGALWFTDSGINFNHVGRITTTGVITEQYITEDLLGEISAGPNGTLWFIDINLAGYQVPVTTLYRVTKTGATPYTVPTILPEGPLGSVGPQGLTAGPDGALWFTLTSGLVGDGIGRLGGLVEPEISTTASGLAYSRVTDTFNGTVTIENISGTTVGGPFLIVFSSLSPGLAIANATSTSNESLAPFISVPAVDSLTPGQSATVNVRFANPSFDKISYIPMVYAGSSK
jgi:virginiamycin B lyase